MRKSCRRVLWAKEFKLEEKQLPSTKPLFDTFLYIYLCRRPSQQIMFSTLGGAVDEATIHSYALNLYVQLQSITSATIHFYQLKGINEYACFCSLSISL